MSKVKYADGLTPQQRWRLRNPDKVRQHVLESFLKWKTNNPERYREAQVNANRRRNQKRRALIDSYKNKPCMDCHSAYPSYVMHFDHVSDKKFNIGNYASRNKAIADVIAEIEKCEVVCSNCHAERTARRGGWSRNGN